MAILKYTASADNTITNAFDDSLVGTNRGTGSNSGKADVMEVFGIYGQSSSSSGLSSEISRALVQFDVSKINADRTAGTLPSQGGVNFFLKLYNTPHASTTPEDYKLTIARVTNAWEEGYGLDLDNYTDKTYDGVGSNWVNANGTFASASITLKYAGGSNAATLEAQTFTLTNTAGTSQSFTFDYDSSTLTGGTIGLNSQAISRTDLVITAIKSAINNVKSTLDITASTITAVGDNTGEQTLLIKQMTTGYAGNTAVDLSGVTGLSISGSATGFTSGSGKWAIAGGDFSIATNDFVDASFPKGTEDLEVDVTTIVENWLGDAPTNQNYGFMVKLSSSLEPYYIKC